MKRVVITGLGIVSSIGNNRAEVTESLKTGKSGIEYCEKYAELGLRSHIHGPIRLNLDELINRKLRATRMRNARHYRPHLIVDQYMVHWLLSPGYSSAILFLYL